MQGTIVFKAHTAMCAQRKQTREIYTEQEKRKAVQMNRGPQDSHGAQTG